jgi:RNA polymerase sigma-70 factor (ECF subfamily)
MDEDELLERCRRGNGEAFAVLLTRHQTAFFNLAFRMLGDREDAMDAIQDACIKAWRAMPAMRGGSFRSWMNSIVARTALDRIRTRRPQSPLEDETGQVIQLPDPHRGPEAQAVANEQVRAIEKCLRRLSPDHRAIILMRDLSDMSYDEIAAALNLPIGTVRSRLARARAHLHQELLRESPNILKAEA